MPRNLAKYPFSGDNSLSQFGMIKGMALPVLFFPSALLGSISTLLIPEMSEASARGRAALVSAATRNILKLTAVMSFIFAAIFFTGGRGNRASNLQKRGGRRTAPRTRPD